MRTSAFVISLLVLLSLACVCAGPQHRPLHGDKQIRNRSHQLCSGLAGGCGRLRKGGSAVDAAIAANAVLGVTEPMMNGIGGDLFAIYWDAKTGKLYGLNSSGWAPQALTLEHMKAKGVRQHAC